MMSACAIGLDSVLLVTKTGIAIDADTEPPTLDIGYARREAVIAPVFKDGKVLPVMTTIGGDLGAFGFGVKQSFATGDAALIMAKELASERNHCDKDELGLCPKKSDRPGTITTKRPDQPPGFLSRALFGDSERQRYLFGTDTVFGLHVKWGTGEVPRSVVLGFKRKELAHVPLIEKETNGNIELRLASLLATADFGAKIGAQSATRVGIAQTFATGEAATLLSAHPGVREVLGQRLFPDYDQIKRFQTYRDHFGLQKASWSRITQAFKKQTNPNKQKIAGKAKTLNLNVQSVTDDAFAQELSDAVDGNDPAVTEKLKRLEEFILELP